MGLYVHSLGEVPSGAKRNYYVYLLDYGWDEPLGEAIRANIPQMADRASRSNAAVIHGPRGTHFADEVLSWHHINGEPAEDLLPALLITTRHPKTFRESFAGEKAAPVPKDALLLVPLKKICSNASQVVDLVDRVFKTGGDRHLYSYFPKCHFAAGHMLRARAGSRFALDDFRGRPRRAGMIRRPVRSSSARGQS